MASDNEQLGNNVLSDTCGSRNYNANHVIYPCVERGFVVMEILLSVGLIIGVALMTYGLIIIYKIEKKEGKF